MNDSIQLAHEETFQRLKWIMFSRLVFTSILLLSTIAVQWRQGLSPMSFSLILLYALTIGIFMLSGVYAAILPRVRRMSRFAFWQLAIDTVFVSLIIYLTGGFASIFAFLYLLVVIYAAILIKQRGTMIIAAMCSIQYGIMIDLEYYHILAPLHGGRAPATWSYDWIDIVYRIIVTMAGCFAVAFLSNLLGRQLRRTNQKLEIMEAKVKRIEQMACLGEMAAGLAHEIKNPLASMTGSVQLLRDEAVTDPAHQRLLGIVLREADRLNGLVNNFLLFARPAEGRKQPTEISNIITETVMLFQKNAEYQKRIAIETDLADHIWLEIDPGHLRQVLWNLLLNAAQSIPETGKISIRTQIFNHRRARLKIADTGVGMTRATIDQIFTPFYTTRAHGSGLGLSVVHSLLSAYHIDLTVRSRPGTGSTFIMDFVRVKSPVGQAAH